MTRPAWVLLTALLALTACGDDDDSNGGGEPGGSAGSAGSPGTSGAAGAAGDSTQDECVAPECVATIGAGSVLAIAIDSQKRPVVMYTGDDEATSTSFLSSFWVRRLEGNTWVALGAPHRTGQFGIVGEPKLVIDPSDRPIVAYGTTDLTMRAEVYEGSSWKTIADDASTTYVGALFLTPTGLLVLGGKLVLTSGSAFSSATSTWSPLPGAGIEDSLKGGTLDGTTPLIVVGSITEAAKPAQLYKHDGAAWVATGSPVEADAALDVRGLARPEGGSLTALLHVQGAGTVTGAKLSRLDGTTWTAPEDVHPADDPLPYNGARMTTAGSSLLVTYARQAAKATESNTLFVRRLAGGTLTTIDTYASSNTLMAATPRVAAQGTQAGITWAAPTAREGFYIGYRAVTLP